MFSNYFMSNMCSPLIYKEIACVNEIWWNGLNSPLFYYFFGEKAFPVHLFDARMNFFVYFSLPDCYWFCSLLQFFFSSRNCFPCNDFYVWNGKMHVMERWFMLRQDVYVNCVECKILILLKSTLIIPFTIYS